MLSPRTLIQADSPDRIELRVRFGEMEDQLVTWKRTKPHHLTPSQVVEWILPRKYAYTVVAENEPADVCIVGCHHTDDGLLQPNEVNVLFSNENMPARSHYRYWQKFGPRHSPQIDVAVLNHVSSPRRIEHPTAEFNARLFGLRWKTIKSRRAPWSNRKGIILASTHMRPGNGCKRKLLWALSRRGVEVDTIAHPPPPDDVKRSSYLMEKPLARLYSGYKFVICHENSIAPGYMTEKIWNALLGGAIPVYCGAEDFGRWVPPNLVLSCTHINTVALADKMIRMMARPEIWTEHAKRIDAFVATFFPSPWTETMLDVPLRTRDLLFVDGAENYAPYFRRHLELLGGSSLKETLVYSLFGDRHKSVSGRRHRVLVSGEPFDLSGRTECTLLLDCKDVPAMRPPNMPFVYIPFYRLHMVERTRHTAGDVDGPVDPGLRKTRFCAFLYSNPVPFREKLFFELSRYRGVDALGFSPRGRGTRTKAGRKDPLFYDTSVDMYKPYKFVICCENTRLPGYITEKIVSARLAGCIPIYLGAPDWDQHINPKAIVDASRPGWVEKVRAIDQNDGIRKKMLSEKLFIQGNATPVW